MNIGQFSLRKTDEFSFKLQPNLREAEKNNIVHFFLCSDLPLCIVNQS